MKRAVVALALALAVAACSATPDASSPDEVAERLEVFTNFRGADAEAFTGVLATFTERTGIQTRHVGTAALAQRLPERIRNGDPPAVALVPQPALIEELARAGHLTALDSDVEDAVSTLLPGAEAIGVVDGTRYGVWFKLSLKSLVWYPADAFDDAGYDVPATFDELLGLSRRIQESETAPWCLGVESFGATGWVGTDWIEDLVLRLHGPEVYDEWVQGDIAFTDERIREAFEVFGTIAFTDGFVLGGPRAALTTPALSAIDPMLEPEPACLMSKQASFQEGELPPGTQIGPDGELDVFVLPPADEEGPPPLLAAGEVAVAFDGSDETRALMAFLADPDAGASWAATGGFTSPHATFDPEIYASSFDAMVGDLAGEADVVRFDGSDQMPTDVGTGTFWAGIIDYLAGVELDVVLEDIQRGYGTEVPAA